MNKLVSARLLSTSWRQAWLEINEWLLWATGAGVCRSWCGAASRGVRGTRRPACRRRRSIGVFERADYLKLNTGIMLLRVHPWSLALVERILHYGRKRARRRHALVLQSHLTNLPVGCLDDQAVLLHLLHDERERWAAHTYLERRFMLQVVCNETRTSLAPDG